MSHRILEQLQSQHQQLSLFLYSFRQQIQTLSDPFINTDIFLILEMLDFINLFPEQLHHPVEDILFKHLLTKDIDEKKFILNILDQHNSLEARTGQIREEFTALDSKAASTLDRLAEDTLEYIDDQMEHLFYEEEELFPLIEDNFDENDWLHIEQSLESFEQESEINGFRAAAAALVNQISRLDNSGENAGMDPSLDTHRDH